jgi:molecular chaperone GrpE (heat shock protein)
MNHLKEITEAGQKMAEEQYPIYLEKQKELEQHYKNILKQPTTESEERKKEEEEKLDSMTVEKRWAYQREQQNVKHIQRMTRKERQDQIDHLMQRLYFGLDEIPVPNDFEYLVKTNNPTMDKVNYYNIVLASQDALRKTYPDVFSD